MVKIARGAMLLLSGLLPVGCSQADLLSPHPMATKPDAASESAAPMAAPRPRPAARRVEEFDTTSPEQRAAAVAQPAASAERKLGRTIASLGDPTDPGFWVKSPLVKTSGKGRIVDVANGRSVLVDLKPLPGDEGAGSQVSLPALRLLGVGLTALPEVVLYAF